MKNQKTLIVSYVPRGERSHTKKLLDTFQAEVKSNVEVLDITKDVPDFFLQDNLMSYIKRNYMGETLNPADAKAIAKMDRMTEQFMKADIVVMAFPMYNFSLPAAVKAYFDSILLKGKTWDMNETGFVGLMKNKKALILMASGGDYGNPQMSSWDHAISLAKLEFQFMGFTDVRSVTVGGLNMPTTNADEVIGNGKAEVLKTVKDWYR